MKYYSIELIKTVVFSLSFGIILFAGYIFLS